jgi:hypothetical protein
MSAWQLQQEIREEVGWMVGSLMCRLLKCKFCAFLMGNCHKVMVGAIGMTRFFCDASICASVKFV